MDSPYSLSKLTALLESFYSMSISEISISEGFQNLLRSDIDKELILEAIPSTPSPSHRPLALLHLLLSELPGSWPTFPLIRSYTRLYHLMPEDAKSHEDKNLAQLVRDTLKLVKDSYKSFGSFVVPGPQPALRATTPGDHITHDGLRKFVDTFYLPTSGHGRKPVVAIALPNGPLLAAACIAVTTYYTSAPINPAAGAEQFRADVQQAGAQFILTTRDDCNRLGLGDPWVAAAGIEVFLMEWESNDRIDLKDLGGAALLPSRYKPIHNKPEDFGLILFTSGTSGTKKVVPLTIHSIIAGISFVIDSWGLTASDICLNMMPLYHVGGLVRNIFAPVFSGGSTVCCPAFDPNLFWDVVQETPVTWYYASPSMHSVVLAAASERSSALQQSRIRLACNAAGGLLPSLACRLRDTFKCTVLPSYGMTECMPISTPPLNYKLDREGTSGISTGPEISILDWSDASVQSGTVGRICVRGEPVFPGYLKPDGTLDRSPFNLNGWFDTGDLGYMDKDGYLYITGRSKEVINRGGELISPFEVENAIMRSAMTPGSPLYGRVTQALAFSVAHDVLQEVVAVVLVSPLNVPRIDLKTLHNSLRSSLQQAKWPVLVTYMDDLPKKNNKVLRIKLSQRCGIPELTDDMPYLSRHWQATCPLPDTDMSVPIESSPCSIDHESLSTCLKSAMSTGFRHYYRQHNLRGTLEAFISPVEASLGALNHHQPDALKQQLAKCLHGYMVPEHIHMLPDPLPLDHSGAVDNDALDGLLAKLGSGASSQELEASTQGRVRKVFADVLCQPPRNIALDVDFFTLGGDSLKAGRLASALRSAFNIQIPISLVFNQGTVSVIATFIDKMAEFVPADDAHEEKVGCSKAYSSTNPVIMLLQLIPLAVIYPLRRAVQWTAFIVVMSYVQRWPTNQHTPGRLFNVAVSVMFAKFIIRIISPIFGIAAKWLIIGRHREGLYPMWGVYHTRWWMVQKIVSICGKGVFNTNDSTKRLYYRLMGAKIGKNVKITGTSLGEWDLLDIRDNVTLTHCLCRPFAVEGNTSMYLGRIVIGENASIGVSSILAPGSIVPPNTCIGPNSSSWELEDAAEENRDLSPTQAVKPHILLTCFLTVPLVFISWALSILPWMAGLVGMVGDMALPDASTVRDILDWFSAARRVGFHSLALILRCSISPFIFFAFAVLVKLLLDAVLGKMSFGTTRDQGAIAIWRAALMKTLLPVSRLHDVTSMFGQHYEATSVAVRLLGGRVGKRVYWPGTGPGIGDYHLLDIGNDVVFGSRSHLITSDGIGSEKITIQDRAMIADRVCLLPGVTVGDHTTMGSGALTRRGKSYPSGGTFVGSKGRDCIHLSGGHSIGYDEKKPVQHRMRHMSSDDTLAGINVDSKKSSVQTRIQRTGSDETLAESRTSRVKNSKTRHGSPEEVFTPSESDTYDNESETEADRMSPFGRAFYLKLAPYYVLGPFIIFCYSSFITVFTSFYWNVPTVACVQLVDYLMNLFISRDIAVTFDVTVLFLVAWAGLAVLFTTMAILALLIVIASKWALLGRRAPGNYDWDKSSYCQRWQLFLSIERLRRHCYHSQGVLGLLTGTSWIVFYFRALGANIGKDCALFANGSPSLMFTEPDLITLGDRVSIDDASVVGHINTRGKFDLNRLSIGDRCVMRSGSRLLSGATMKNDSCLLEHTLIMGGDVVEENWTMQGWPAERYTGKRTAIE